MREISVNTMLDYVEFLETDASWLTNYAQGKKDCQRLIEVTTTMYRAAWALRTLAREE